MSTSPVFQNFEKIDTNTVKFTLTPTRVTYANSFRRAMETEIQCLGFNADIAEDGSTTDVKVIKNTTPMSNEMLADRIGLLPIFMPKGYETWKKKDILFKLHVVNDSEVYRPVTASDFACIKQIDETTTEQIPNTEFFHPNPITSETCLIATLKPMIPGQKPEEIHIEAYASLGTGREHARWIPTSQCSYGYTLDPDQSRNEERWKKWLFEQKNVKDLEELEKDPVKKERLNREYRSLEVQRCFLVDPVSGEPYSFDFTVQSVGSLDPIQIISKGILALIQLCSKYVDIDTGDLPPHVTIQPTQMKMLGQDIIFQKETYTFGNLIQTFLVDKHVGQGKYSKFLSFVGVIEPHPLRSELKMTFGFSDSKENTRENVRYLLSQAAKECVAIFTQWHTQFIEIMEGQKTPLPPKTPEGGLKGPWQAHAEGKPAPTTQTAPVTQTQTTARGRGRGRGGTARGGRT